MQEVLSLIAQKQQEFSRKPLFCYMQEKRIHPKQRLAFAPCLAPFVMNFGDLNKFVFREEPTQDPIQKLINTHTYEDDHHWIWFLDDIRKLGLDRSINFSESLRFLWSKETEKTRQLSYTLLGYAFQADPLQKLVAIEVAEATGNVMFSASAQVCHELKLITGKDYKYFGEFHLAVETGHMTGSPDVDQLIAAVELTEETRKEACEVVEKVFAAFTDSMNELMVYAQSHPIGELLNVAL